MALQRVVNARDAVHFKFATIGDVLKGHYLGHDIININGKDIKKHLFNTSKGLVSTLGSTDLDRNLGNILTKHGTGVYMEVTYEKNVKGKNPLPMKSFIYDFDLEDVSSIAVTSEPEPVMEADTSDEDPTLFEEPVLPVARVTKNPVQPSEENVSRVKAALSRTAR